MQFRNRSLILATAALAFVNSAVAAPLNDLVARRYSWQVNSGYTGAGVYTITSYATGTNLDLYNGDTKSGTPITGWTAQAANNLHQQWRMSEADPKSGYLSIQNVGSGTFIAADPKITPKIGGALNKLTALAEDPSKALPLNVLWGFEAFYSSSFVAFSNAKYADGDYVMDLSGSNPANGADVLLYPTLRDSTPDQYLVKNQLWVLTRIGD
ncbi:MAG: hypothetical protein M1812_001993 [Candelaria pacifica]|nr:MAG: hypothetical protein M1812_001993 [Candelaria pacifica]